jgi:signal transduction histidine kinase
MALLNSNDITELEFHELKGDVDRQLNSVTQLLDNLLKWSKNHLLGSSSVKPEKLNLQRLAEQSLALIEPAAEKKKIRLENNIAAGTTAMADAGQMDIVLRNLITNALKFTAPGGRIQVGAATEGNRTKIWVSDTGVGMSPEKVKTVFTATPDNSTYGTAGEKGIGLGLLLCHEFVLANGGTIGVTSELGKGTRFEVELAAG